MIEMPYPVLPRKRLAYDVDGTQVFVKASLINGGTLYEAHPTAVAAMNSTVGGGAHAESGLFGSPSSISGVFVYTHYVLFIFPEPVNLSGIYFSSIATSGSKEITGAVLKTSQDSTNGEDGIWDRLSNVPSGQDWARRVAASSLPAPQTVRDFLTGNVVVNGVTALPPTDSYRKDYSLSGLGVVKLSGQGTRNVRALRLENGIYQEVGTEAFGSMIVHLYGELSGKASQQRLEFWQTDSDLPADSEFYDWGDVSLGSSGDKSIRVKNLSTDLRAENVRVYCEDLLGYSPTVLSGQFLFSLDGAVWTNDVQFSTLSPSAVSPEIQIRRVTPNDAPLASWSPRMRLDVGGWL